MSTTTLKLLSIDPAIDVEVVSDAPAIVPASATPAPWERVRHYVDLAGLHLAASTGAQVLAGMELLGLHQTYKVRRGPKSANSFHDERNWNEAVKAELGVSETTAWRWMEMGKAARKRLAKDNTDLAALLEQPPGAMTADERETLKRAVHRITDGVTQTDLMLEWGITRPRTTAKGGNLGGTRTTAENTDIPAVGTINDPQLDQLNTLTIEILNLDIYRTTAPLEQRREVHGNLLDLVAGLAASLKEATGQ